jgi:hypothetical protein
MARSPACSSSKRIKILNNVGVRGDLPSIYLSKSLNEAFIHSAFHTVIILLLKVNVCGARNYTTIAQNIPLVATNFPDAGGKIEVATRSFFGRFHTLFKARHAAVR